MTPNVILNFILKNEIKINYFHVLFKIYSIIFFLNYFKINTFVNNFNYIYIYIYCNFYNKSNKRRSIFFAFIYLLIFKWKKKEIIIHLVSKLDLRQKTNSWQKSKSKTQAKWSLKLLAKTWSVGQGWDERKKIIKKKRKKKEKGEGEIRRKQITKPNSIEKGGTTHKSRVSCHSSVSLPQPPFTSVREASYLSLSLSLSLPLPRPYPSWLILPLILKFISISDQFQRGCLRLLWYAEIHLFWSLNSSSSYTHYIPINNPSFSSFILSLGLSRSLSLSLSLPPPFFFSFFVPTIPTTTTTHLSLSLWFSTTKTYGCESFLSFCFLPFRPFCLKPFFLPLFFFFCQVGVILCVVLGCAGV